MPVLRNILVGAASLALAVLAVALFATVGLAVLGGVAVAGIASALMLRFGPHRRRAAPGVRRDAHGIVIDMEPVR